MKYMLIHCIDESAERARRPADRQQDAPSIESWLEEMRARGVLLHGNRADLARTLDETLLGLRPRPALFLAA